MSCATTKETVAPINKPLSFLTMDNTQVIYRGYDSMFEYGANCPSGCETYLEVEGGELHPLSPNTSNTALISADSLSDQIILRINCACKQDTTLLLTKKYPILEIPHPAIYYGGVNLTDYTRYNDTITFHSGGIYASYEGVPGLINSSASIANCSYTYRGQDYSLNAFTKTFPASIWNELKLGETIKFNSIKMRYADGRFVTLYLKREIIKASTIDSNVFILK